ncbi:MAG: hypothetical protein FJZ92_00845 [Chloroflexi bacterium]|nr:hypothetical protein [Chloroflexota bacterium]
MNPLCSHCLSALPFGWPEIEDCAECAALEAVDTALAAPAGGRAIAIDLPDRATYFDWPEASWHLVPAASPTL